MLDGNVITVYKYTGMVAFLTDVFRFSKCNRAYGVWSDLIGNEGDQAYGHGTYMF